MKLFRQGKKRGIGPIEFCEKTRTTMMVKGEMVSVSTTRPALENLYYSLFKMRCKRTRKSDLQLVYNVEMVVWGALHLEAMVNLICMEYLGFWMREAPGGGMPVWENVELAKTEKKLRMLCEGMKINKGLAKRMIGRLSRVVGIRNRLVHYKEQPLKVNDRSFITHMLWFGKKGNVAEPPLIVELRGQGMTKVRDEIIKLSEWLRTLTMKGGMEKHLLKTLASVKKPSPSSSPAATPPEAIPPF